MAIVVNTNVQSLKVQNNLNRVTDKMNTAMERMTTGLKINTAADDAAGLVISKGIEVQTRGTQVAKDNAQNGINLLQTAEGNLAVIQDNLMRVRDLTLQAMNGGQTATEVKAIEEEVTARIEEVSRLAGGAKFNNFQLFSDSNDEVRLQIGTGADESQNTITISDVFDSATISALTGGTSSAKFKLTTATGSIVSAGAFSTILTATDKAITEISTRRGKIGAISNRLSSAMQSLDTQYENLSAAGSRITDSDVATESSNYTQYNILQQASASLLVQANQAPSIALSLI